MSAYVELRFLNIAHFIDHFVILIFPTAVLALHLVWDLSYAEALVYGTPAFVMFAAATLPFGWLGDHYGGRPLMKLFFIGTGLSLIMTAMAQTPFQLGVGLAVVGTFAAIYHPVATAMIVALSGNARGRELGVNGVWGNLGVAFAAAATAALAAWLGWRAAFWVPGVIVLAFGLVYLRVAAAHLSPISSNAVSKQRIERSVQIQVFAIIAVCALFNGLVFGGVTIALPKLVEERLDADLLGLAGIGFVATLIFVCASFTQMLTGRMVDRHGPRPVMLVTAGIQIPLLALAAWLWGPWLVPVGILMMLGVFGIVPVASWLLGQYVDAAWRSRAYAFQFMLALGVHAAVVPIVTAMHAGTGDMTRLFEVLALAAVPVFLAAFLLPARTPDMEFAGKPAAT